MKNVLAFPEAPSLPAPPRGATQAEAAAWGRLVAALASAGLSGAVGRHALRRHVRDRCRLEQLYAEARQAGDLARRLAALEARTLPPADSAVLSALADDLFVRDLARAAATAALQLRLGRRLARWGLTPRL